MAADEYDEFYDPTMELTKDEYVTLTKIERNEIRRKKQVESKYEVGLVPPLEDEVIARRKRYETDYVALHQEVFKRSTGIKPFGPAQITSLHQTLHILTHRGRAVIAEPRGFGKTSRTTNNCLAAILQGKIRYGVILGSSVTKANEILESILTELIDNEELALLYPAVTRCFERAMDSIFAAKYQTYGGEPTNILIMKDRIRFPQIEGEPCSGSVIQVRPKDNVRGLFTKIRYGPESGRVLRPDFAFMDDIQTDEEAKSPTVPEKIIQTIKKSVLFAGSHSKRISALMCCTPIAPGDVATHFILNEPSWEVTLSKMVTKMPTRLDLWLGDYRDIRMNFNRFVPGDSLRAALEAKQFVIDNYDELHEGHDCSWEWAYGWDEDPQTEISALHHAMNFLIEEGPDSFESECQCNVEAKNEDGTDIKATIEEITSQVSRFPRFHCPVDCKYITTHIDVNKGVFTYVTMASPQIFRGSVVDYGTWPKQPGSMWEKGKLINPLTKQYPDIPELDARLYIGLSDLLDKLVEQEYTREDGAKLIHNLITIDMGWKIEEVQRAIRDHSHRHIMHCARGQGLSAKVRQFDEKKYGADCIVYHHCALLPTIDRQLMALYMDVNYFKTMVHKGFKSRQGIIGSIELFHNDHMSNHVQFARHVVSESPMEDKDDTKGITVIIWSPPKGDNEYFDNIVGCCANFMKLGVKLSSNELKQNTTFDMQEYINAQKKAKKK